MLNKENLFFVTEMSDVFDKKIVGQITSRYSSNVLATGYWKDRVGSCTASEILQMCDQGDSSSLEYYKFYLSTADFGGVTLVDPQQRAALGSFRLLIDGILINGFIKCDVSRSGRYSYVSVSKPRFCTLLNSVKDGSSLYSKCVFCEERSYPKLVTMSDLEMLNSYPEGHSLHTTDTKYTQGENTAFFQLENQFTAIGLEANKTYDFTLEYKIDAIITEDGVQTF